METPGAAPLLSGVVGSTAYGLATAASDTDRLGVYAEHTARLLGLHAPRQTYVHQEPDFTWHEAGKFASLCLKCNPTVTELLWLPKELYEVRHTLGLALIGLREAFLSEKYVRNAYLGYARQQFERIRVGRKWHNYDPEVTPEKAAKHARHLWRLCVQGTSLWTTGQLKVRLDEDEARTCREFGEKVAAGELEIVETFLRITTKMFDNVDTSLPEKPDEAVVEGWLQTVRRAYYR